MPKKIAIKSLVFLGLYILVRFVFDAYWRTITPYAAYGFEAGFVLAVGIYFGSRIQYFKFQKDQLLYDFLFPLLGGLAIYKLGTYSGISIPFDLSSYETLFILLLLAPVLEELIFRMALWEPLKELCKSPSQLLISTSLLFSIGHFMALWNVPEQYRIFVLYQTLYVILLGLGAGWRRMQTNSVSAAIYVHFSFNLGFFLASRI